MSKQTFVSTNLITGKKELLKEGSYNTLIEFLLEQYPDGFNLPTTIYINTDKIELDNYDITLSNNDFINIVYHPAAATVAIFAVKLAVGLAIGYGIQKMFEEDVPDLPSSQDYAQTSASATYELNNASNTAQAGMPIPVTYGSVRTYPGLIEKPYYRYDGNDQYMYSLMCLGQGDYTINDLFVGETNVETLGNNVIEYKKITPNEYVDECTLRNFIGDGKYHQTVYRSPEVSNIEIDPGSKIYTERFRFQGDKVFFYKGTDGVFPNLTLSIGDTIEFHLGNNSPDGLNPVGVHNNAQIFTIIDFDLNEHSLTLGTVQSEAFRNILSSVNTTFQNNTTISSSGNDLIIKTTGLTVSSQSLKDDFWIGQTLQVINSDDSLTTVSITAIDYDLSLDIGSLILTTNTALNLNPKEIKANDVAGSFTAENTYGFFKSNPEGTEAKHIELDIVFPSGLFRSDTTGNLLTRKIKFQITVRDELNNESIHNYSIVEATKTSVRKTIIVSVDDLEPGSYNIKIRRTTAAALDTATQDRMFLQSLKAPIVLNYNNDWGNLTLLWVKAKATNGLSEAGQFKINANITRIDINNNLDSVIKDIYSNNNYGGKLNINDIDSPVITDVFNGTFETRVPILEAMKTVGKSNRYIVTPKGGDIIIRKDDIKPFRTSMFNETNIIENTLEIGYNFGLDENSYDGYEIEYRDPLTFKPLVVLYPDTSINPKKEILFGCTSYESAVAEAQYRYKSERSRRIQFIFDTDIQGVIPEYLDRIMIAHNTADAGFPGIVMERDTDKFSLQEIIQEKSKVSFINEFGQHDGPYNVTWLDSIATVIGLPTYVNFNTRCHFYDEIEETYDAIITKISPSGQDSVKIEAVNYDENVYIIDEVLPPAGIGTGSCNTGGIPPLYDNTITYNIGDTVSCPDGRQFIALETVIGEDPCSVISTKWDELFPGDPGYGDPVIDTPPMPGEDDNGATVEVPGPEAPEEPEIDWATIAGITVLGGLIAWGAVAGVEALFGECDFGMNYHPGTNTCEFCPENQVYNEEENTCESCGTGLMWDSATKLCVEQESCDPCGAGNGASLWDAAVNYDEGDMVSWFGTDPSLGTSDYSNYISLVTDNRSNDPFDTVDIFWKLSATKGDKGDKGDIGPEGPTGAQGVDGKDGVCPDCPPTEPPTDPCQDPVDCSNPANKDCPQCQPICPPGEDCRPANTCSGDEILPVPPVPTKPEIPASEVPKDDGGKEKDPCFTFNPSSGRNVTDPNQGTNISNKNRDVNPGCDIINALKPGCIDGIAQQRENWPDCPPGQKYNKDINTCISTSC